MCSRRRGRSRSDIEDAALEVGFPPSAAFNKRKAEAAEARDRLADAMKTIAGASLRPHYVLLDADDAEVPAGSELSEDELVELMRASSMPRNTAPSPTTARPRPRRRVDDATAAGRLAGSTSTR